MLALEGLKFELQSDQLFIHFDVKDHYLKLETYVATAQRAQRIVDALDQTFFQGQLEYELIVLPPELGSFLSRLAIAVWGGFASVFAFMETDIGKAYVKGLTGEEPAHWSQQIGEDHRKTIEDVTEEISSSDDQNIEKKQHNCRVSAKIVTEMTRGVLEKDKIDLERLGMETGSLPDAVEARNEFYEVCIADTEVQGVGFTPEDDFPIPRNAFPERALKVRRKEDDEEELPWSVGIESIFVNSPNWDKDDQKSRQWKGKDSVRRDRFFVIEDEEFWFHVKNRDLHVEVLDVLKVQWAFQKNGKRTRNLRVLRVLEFNGEKLADPLPPEAIGAILGNFNELGPSDRQGTLL